jgi:hypothetical protein
MFVTQGYRSTAGEVQGFLKDPDPVRVIKALLNIVGDMAERVPGVVGDLAHRLRNPPPGDRSNWMRENKAYLENKRLYQISLASHPVYYLQTVADSSVGCSPELMTRVLLT